MMSWVQFFAFVPCCVLVLFLPGLLICSIMKVGVRFSLGIAPAISVALYSVLAIALKAVGAMSTILTVFILPSVVLLLLALAGFFFRKRLAGRKSVSWDNASVAVLYVVFGIAVSVLFFLRPLDGPSSYVQMYDNAYHLNVINSFLSSGNWSSLSTTVYPDSPSNEIPLRTSESFYPSGWHILATLVVQMTGIDIPAAVNVLNFTLISIAYPLSLYAFMLVLFPRNVGVQIAGALCSLCFAMFPWSFLYTGPQYPNMVALLLLPGVASAFVSFFPGRNTQAGFLSKIIVFLVACIGLVFVHPNSVFTAVVLLAPFCVQEIVTKLRRGTRDRLLAAILFCLFVAVVWWLIFNSQFLKSVLSFYWESTYSIGDAIAVSLASSYMKGQAQLLVATFVAIGMLVSLKRTEYVWLTVSHVLFSLLFVIAAATDGFLKEYLTGFWYTDSGRIASAAALFSVPLAALGLSWIVGRLRNRAQRSFKHDRLGGNKIVNCAIALLLLMLVYTPVTEKNENGIIGSGQLGYASRQLSEANKASGSQMLNEEEKSFLEKVKERVGDSLVLNNPYDGSVFAFFENDINVYFRSFNVYGGNATDQSVEIRYGLSDIASDDSVRRAVDDTDAAYLLLLDFDTDQSSTEMDTISLYKPQYWTGMTSVDDGTPGFSLVLSEGDMRLYKVDDVLKDVG